MAPDEGAALHRSFARAREARDAHACFDPLSQYAPECSAKAGVNKAQALWLCVFLVSGAAAGLFAPQIVFPLLAGAAVGLFSVLIILRYAAAFSPLATDTLETPAIFPFYTILCPVYREAAALPGLIAALDALRYPKDRLEILILVEPDDAQTRRVAEIAAARRRNMRVITSPDEGPRTKPKALNAGLSVAQGALLTVYDAEDRPHSDQLIAAVSTFARGGEDLACVQAPLRAYNGEERWIAGQFALEYAVQFGLLLPLFVRLRWPILLGGTSNHFRTSALRQLHGWDSYNVTEDADLGLRLARSGFRADLIAPPTYEEAPISLRAWRRQRTRWIKGHLMTWLVHMRRPAAMLRELGLWKFIGVHLSLGGGLASSLVHGWLVLAALGFLLMGGDWRHVLSIAGIGYAAALACALRVALEVRSPAFAWRGALAPFYWPLQSLAALAALIELFRAPHIWAKTEHGLTRTSAPTIGLSAASGLHLIVEKERRWGGSGRWDCPRLRRRCSPSPDGGERNPQAH